LLERCHLSKDAGPCFDSILRFYWSADDGECRPFTYGGCGGNDNQFSSADECYDRCAPTTPDDHPRRRTYSPADCLQPRAEGQCDDAEVRWYFDSEQRDCLAFYYTGCGANGNNFRDYDDCFAFCSSGRYSYGCLVHTLVKNSGFLCRPVREAAMPSMIVALDFHRVLLVLLIRVISSVRQHIPPNCCHAPEMSHFASSSYLGYSGLPERHKPVEMAAIKQQNSR